MAETVNVSSSPGANYSWTSGTFTWGSATAGKNWSTAYPAVYALSVATDLSFAELAQKLGIKRSSETLALAEKPSRALTLSKFETLSFVETYTDLIAFVLRFVESLTFSEKYARTGTKAVFEVFQVTEGLARQLALRKYETLALAETYTDLIAYILRVSESLSFAEKPSKAMTKPQSESFGMSDALARSNVKRVAEAFSFAESLGRTVAYRLAISEGFAIADRSSVHGYWCSDLFVTVWCSGQRSQHRLSHERWSGHRRDGTQQPVLRRSGGQLQWHLANRQLRKQYVLEALQYQLVDLGVGV